ncbi:MAG: helix-turn-helix domain-containing protein [Lachnospiraceae bacterium]
MGMATIPERLVKAREFIGHNRKSFAEKLNIPYRTITNYENGSREPGSDYILKVANICGCTTDWLLGLSDNPRNNSPYSDLVVQEGDSLFEALRVNYGKLNEEGREKLVDYSDDLVQSSKYKKFVSSGILQEEA